MRKTIFLKWALVLYAVIAVFMVGIVHATFMQDEDTKYGTYGGAYSLVSGEYYSGQVHDPFYRSRGWNSTNLPTGNMLYVEYYWYANDLWIHAYKYDVTNSSSLLAEDNFDGDVTQATCETRAGNYSGGVHTPYTEWAIAGIPLNP